MTPTPEPVAEAGGVRADGWPKGDARVEALHVILLREFGINQQSNGRLLRILDAIDTAAPATSAPAGDGEAEIEAVAAAIRQQRNGAITPPSEGTDYDRRLAIAAIAALRRAQPPQPTGDVGELVERLRFDAARCEATYSKGIASNIEAAIALLISLDSRLAELAEQLHYANGTCGLAMKGRDEAEARVAELEKVLLDIQPTIEQAISCIRGETPEDCAFGEAEDDTFQKLRDADRVITAALSPTEPADSFANPGSEQIADKVRK